MRCTLTAWDMRESLPHTLQRVSFLGVSCPHSLCLSCLRSGTSLLGTGFPVKWLIPVPSNNAGVQATVTPQWGLKLQDSVHPPDTHHPPWLDVVTGAWLTPASHSPCGKTLEHLSPCSKRQVLAGLTWMGVSVPQGSSVHSGPSDWSTEGRAGS